MIWFVVLNVGWLAHIVHDIDVWQNAIHMHRKRMLVMATKSETLSVRVEPKIKMALKKAAENEHRSIANMIEVLVLDYCEKNEIDMNGKGVNDVVGSLEND
ncbi:hypothetical protein [Alloalcanivorax xenomutans]|uniref:hypothetical protein n=1 Tax=Alloalcanivorax xenomutans TaxID=1094342 RepID=UPI003BA9E884